MYSTLTTNLRKKDSFKKTSYSQCGEDLIVKFIFDNLKIINPSYLDIGAHHPTYLSNSALFYAIGSRGINIEPDPTLFESIRVQRKNDINLNIGISDEESTLDFYIINVPTLNTFSKEAADNYCQQGHYQIVDTKKIRVNTINNILDTYNKGKFPEFLTIDAEGIDQIVLKTIDYDDNFPIVICVETISFSEKGLGLKNSALIDFLKSKGYLYYADTYINSIFVKEDKWIKT